MLVLVIYMIRLKKIGVSYDGAGTYGYSYIEIYLPPSFLLYLKKKKKKKEEVGARREIPDFRGS